MKSEKINVNNPKHLELMAKVLKNLGGAVKVTKAGYAKIILINKHMTPITTFEGLCANA